MTYRNAADTSDIRKAIGNLSDLAAQSKRQANSMEEQIAEMRDAQRPWLRAIPEIQGPLTRGGLHSLGEGRLTMKTGIGIRNLGHSPAVSVKARAEIAGVSFGDVKKDAKSICASEQETAWTAFIKDSGTDIIFPESEDTIELDAVSNEDDTGWLKLGGLISLAFCVAYKAPGDNATHHTGGTITLSVTTDNWPLKDGESVPAGLLKFERNPFEWKNFAD
jgi:hypothetical protein